MSSSSALDGAKAALANAEIDFDNLPTVVEDPSWNSDIKPLMTLNQFFALKKARCTGM